MRASIGHPFRRAEEIGECNGRMQPTPVVYVMAYQPRVLPGFVRQGYGAAPFPEVMWRLVSRRDV